MSGAWYNPKDGLSADEIKDLVEALQSLLKRRDAAELFDDVTRERIGRIIARSAQTSPMGKPHR